MAVNLNGLNFNGAPASSAQEASATPSVTTSSQNTAPSSDSSVTITSTASLLARLQQVLAARPAVDQGRVDAISTALAAGSYRVNDDKIAQGLIHVERALGQLKAI
jgi:negative regulator of flagellin synthesis FlgM